MLPGSGGRYGWIELLLCPGLLLSDPGAAHSQADKAQAVTSTNTSRPFPTTIAVSCHNRGLASS